MGAPPPTRLLKVKGKWYDLYRAIDREGNLVASMINPTRDMAAAQSFFRGTLSVAHRTPGQVTNDGHDSYLRAIREALGDNVRASLQRFPQPTSRAGSSGVKHGITQYLDLAHLPEPSASIEHSKKPGSTFAPAARENSSSHWASTDDSSRTQPRYSHPVFIAT